MMFNINSKFYYKSSTYTEAFSLRRTNWRRITIRKLGDVDAQNTYNKIVFKFQRRLLYDFINKLYNPMAEAQCNQKKQLITTILRALNHRRSFRCLDLMPDEELTQLSQKFIHSSWSPDQNSHHLLSLKQILKQQVAGLH